MDDLTTIQVRRTVADQLRRLGQGAPYDQAIQQLIKNNAPGPSEILVFSKSVAAATQDEEDRQVQRDGWVYSAVFYFAPGPQFLVDVRLLRMKGNAIDSYLVPSQDNSFITLDDAPAVFKPLNSPVTEGQKLRVQWFNYDGANAHQVPVVVLISPVPMLS